MEKSFLSKVCASQVFGFDLMLLAMNINDKPRALHQPVFIIHLSQEKTTGATDLELRTQMGWTPKDFFKI